MKDFTNQPPDISWRVSSYLDFLYRGGGWIFRNGFCKETLSIANFSTLHNFFRFFCKCTCCRSRPRYEQILNLNEVNHKQNCIIKRHACARAHVQKCFTSGQDCLDRRARPISSLPHFVSLPPPPPLFSSPHPSIRNVPEYWTAQLKTNELWQIIRRLVGSGLKNSV